MLSLGCVNEVYMIGEAPGLQGYFVCAGFNSAGIANSGLTLAALSYRLADLLVESNGAPRR